jgi:hypothetical protein
MFCFLNNATVVQSCWFVALSGTLFEGKFTLSYFSVQSTAIYTSTLDKAGLPEEEGNDVSAQNTWTTVNTVFFVLLFALSYKYVSLFNSHYSSY